MLITVANAITVAFCDRNNLTEYVQKSLRMSDCWVYITERHATVKKNAEYLFQIHRITEKQMKSIAFSGILNLRLFLNNSISGHICNNMG
jgi:hypothetical protein